MHKLAGLGLSYELDTSALLEQKGFCRHWTESATCNTGDSFLTELTDIEGDVVDMEAYAQAFGLYFQRDSFYFSEICIGRDWAELCKTLGRQTG